MREYNSISDITDDYMNNILTFEFFVAEVNIFIFTNWTNKK